MVPDTVEEVHFSKDSNRNSTVTVSCAKSKTTFKKRKPVNEDDEVCLVISDKNNEVLDYYVAGSVRSDGKLSSKLV